MRIGLIFPNKDRKDKAVHLGLGYLASYARSVHADLQFTILDTRVATRKEYNRFFRASFDLVGITVLSPVLHEAADIVKLLKERSPEIPVCAGGPYVTTIREDIFRLLPVDFAVYGEGELTFAELISHLKHKTDPAGIRGLMYRTASGEILANPPRDQISDLNTLPLPAYDLFPMNRYPVHRIATSRGCPFRCSFCNSTSIWSFRWRDRSPENVVAEIEYLLKFHRHKTFSFNDNSFNIRPDRVEKFCDLLIARNIRILWSTPFRAEIVTERMAHKMKKAGCYNVGIGIESANDERLRVMEKKTTIAEITRGIGILKRAGIEVLGQFVIGSEGDTLASVRESLGYARQSELDFVHFYSVLPFRGTRQWDYVRQSGRFFSEEIHEYHGISPRVVFETPDFTKEERLEAIRLASEYGYYCETNDRDTLLDTGREFLRRLERFVPPDAANFLYLTGRKLYRAVRRPV